MKSHVAIQTRGIRSLLSLACCLSGVLSSTPFVNAQNDAPSQTVDQAANTSAVSYQTVYQANTNGYRVFRIPALSRAANGDLLAFCEARQGGDASEIDLVLRRSSDSGQTWSELQVVQESDDFRDLYPGDDDQAAPPITIGNPAPVVDLLDPLHPGRIWLPFTVENDAVFVTYSDDHGHRWSPPVQITEDVKRRNWGWYATGPGHAIQIQHGPHRGRLVIAADHRVGTGGADRGPLGAQLILSDDHGQSWRLGAVDTSYDDGLNANETLVAELADGTLYINTRDQNGEAPGTRGHAWSHDGGETLDSRDPQWTAFSPAPAVLDPPVVQSAVLAFPDGSLLFSGPDEDGPSGPGRSDLRIRVSEDAGLTWSDGPLLHVGPAAYSDMCLLEDRRVGVLFEAGVPGSDQAYQEIRFMTFTLPHKDVALQDRLQSLLQAQAAHWNQGDIDSFMLTYWNNEELTFSSGGETERGWQATRERFHHRYPNPAAMGKLRFSELEVTPLGLEAALMLGRWQLTRAEPVGGNFSLVWRKINGRWLIVHDHSSAVAK